MQFFRKNKKRLRDNFYIKLPIKKRIILTFLLLPLLAGIMSTLELLIERPRKIIWIWCLNTLCTKQVTIICDRMMNAIFTTYKLQSLFIFSKRKYKKFVFITFTKHNQIFSGQKEYMIIILFRVKKYLLKLRTIFEIIIIH